MTTVAELCAGYGGLYTAIQELHPTATLTWVAETDHDASAILAHHHTAPNHGDITTIKWANTEPVDILAAGFPCQPFSTAGKREGTGDHRHLWPTGVMPAIQALNPSVVLLENVDGLRTISGGDVFRRILTDLTSAGYTTQWATIGACTLGLCHHRHRLFMLATKTPAEVPPELGMPINAWSAWPRDGITQSGDVWGHPHVGCGKTDTPLPTPTARDASRAGGRKTPEGRPLSEVIALLPTPTQSDGIGGPGHSGRGGAPNLRTQMAYMPTPKASDATKGGPNQRDSKGHHALPALAQSHQWAQYAHAISRHETVVGRAAPNPTITGKRGGARLNPALTEWMMALPAGYLTGPLAGNPNAANRLAGNGVIPMVAAEAVRIMVRRAGWTTLPIEENHANRQVR